MIKIIFFSLILGMLLVAGSTLADDASNSKKNSQDQLTVRIQEKRMGRKECEGISLTNGIARRYIEAG